MRRNAESLLVLAGIKPPRVWRAPMQISDIVRAALGEVEDYQRVADRRRRARDHARLRRRGPGPPAGRAHRERPRLLAASPDASRSAAASGAPDGTPTTAVGSWTAEEGASPSSCRTPASAWPRTSVARANRRLAGEESFAVAPSQYLGHYVAGTIARRHDITVQMDSDGQRGTRATVTLPSGLLSSEGAAPERAALANRAFAPAAAVHAPPPIPAPADVPVPSGIAPSGARARQVAPATTGLARGGVAGPATQRGPVVIDAMAIADAQRARYVRDTLSKLSAGLDRGRDADVRAHDPGGTSGGVDAEASSPTAHGHERHDGQDADR